MLNTLPLALSFAGLNAEVTGEPDPRRRLLLALGLGVRSVLLDAADPAFRPRDLGPSARRDLASTLGRAGLGCAGLDLWIPPEHFISPATVDRAVAAVEAAVVMQSELGGFLASADRGVVSLVLPKAAPPEVTQALRAVAERHGVLIADHAWPESAEDLRLGWGIDPAAVLAGGGDPVAQVLAHGRSPALARLSDHGPHGRVPVSANGRLDLMAYQAALAAAGYGRAVVIDVRGIREPMTAARGAAALWAAA